MVFQRERRVVTSIAHCTIVCRRMFSCHVLLEREKNPEIRTERRIDKMKILTASKAVSLTNLLSQNEQKGCHALELFICCSRASLFANCLLSHWGQTGMVLELGPKAYE